jgi:hypothetical protein
MVASIGPHGAPPTMVWVVSAASDSGSVPPQLAR